MAIFSEKLKLISSKGLTINPATEDKQKEIIDLLFDIEQYQINGIGKTILLDGNGSIAKIDDSTNSIQVIDHAHHEIHEGSSFYISEVEDASLNEVVDIQLITQASAKESHFRLLLNTEAKTEFFIYEGVTIVNNGTIVDIINCDRNSLNTSVNNAYKQINNSLVNANIDTVVSGAKIIKHGFAGVGKSGGNINIDDEIILKSGTKYTIRTISLSAGYVDFELKWYEHTKN